jgi:hypothetical protein
MLGGPVSGVTTLARLENFSYHMSLDGPAFPLSLSQTSSGIRFGGRNPALLRTPIADCLLRNDYYSVRLIIMQLEQVVTQWNAISLPLFYGSTIYRPVCLFLYRIIHNSLRYVRTLWYSSRDGHAGGEHDNRGKDTPSFCPTLQVLDMSFLLCLSWCLRSRVRKIRSDMNYPV